ncbi:phosphoribosylanthranilate isomerase [Caldanaerobius polysaccharolyticus]|uniref:phosphoribosylanthranilate isomerase n=1 Tax=Caldanaerobius polysaccharolyticus TaxID=44256 RepID=UPI00047BAD6C|nr:phosphoribosylanthranilate isomerase [Caldanaerobius polysaccharolyticus]
MVKVKICGLRRLEDIEYVNALMVDYAGFVFAESKRKVNLNQAKRLAERLDRRIKKVGVFVNEGRDFIEKVKSHLGLDVIQFHGDEKPEDVAGYDVEVWKAIRVSDVKSLKEAEKYPVQKILLDSPGRTNKDVAYGGTGVPFDWSILDDLKVRFPVVLAGGLNPDNVVDAIMKVKPYAVDVSSGVETNGFKDFDKMKKFVERVRVL